jgi:hypothetical protein
MKIQKLPVIADAVTVVAQSKKFRSRNETIF